MNFWVIAPGDQAFLWKECKDGGYICIGWDDDIEDINLYKSKEDIQNQLGPNENGNDQTNNTNSIFSFGKEIKIGDIVIAKKGSTQVVGLGVITSNYIPPSSSNNPRINLDYCHVRRVKWIFDQNSISIEGGNFWIPTVSYLSDDDIRLKNILEQYNISISDIQKKVGNIMSEINNQEIINILKYKYQIILQGPPGTGKTRLAEEIAYQLIFGEAIDNSKREQALEKLSKSEQYKLLQFHPAYSYGDFVRGITAKANDEGYIEYIVENKILGDFAKKAQDNLTTSNKKTDELSEENWINESFESFRKDIIKDLSKKLNLRISIINENGEVVAESHKNIEDIKNHSNRVEIIEARNIGLGKDTRVSETLNKDLIYIAKKVSFNEEIYYLRMADYTNKITDNFKKLTFEILRVSKI